MKYKYYSGEFLKLFYELNKVTEEDLDTSSFIMNNNDEQLLYFKLQLLTLKNKKTLIVGDYDCDGICSTAIIKRLFDYLGFKCNFYIPSREKDGYGLNKDIVKMAYENGFEALLMVDNGIVAKEALALANEYQLFTLIIDHHEYNEEPLCAGYIHPNLLTKDYVNLAASGLCYLVSTMFYNDDYSLVLAGIATYADMVGVLGANRYLLKRCLELLRSGKFYACNLLNDNKEFTYDNLSFNVIPKINAVSRMNYNPNILVKYLLADENTCQKSIASINDINQKRKSLANELIETTSKQIDHKKQVVLLVSEQYTEGLCGLLANRLVNTLNKPVIVFAKKDGILKGSARSVEGFNLYECLKVVDNLFTTFGGHELALGLSMKESDFSLLENYLEHVDIQIKEVEKTALKLDIEELNLDLFNVIESLKPFGSDLKEPLFVIENQNYEKILLANKYPKYLINKDLSAICFNSSLINREVKEMFGYLKLDNYHPNKVNLLIEDLL